MCVSDKRFMEVGMCECSRLYKVLRWNRKALYENQNSKKEIV